METLKPLRTAEVARLAGYSVQQVRNLERDGVLPTAMRTRAGYRLYTQLHVHCALGYRSLAAATGPVEAKRIVRAVHERPIADVLALVDAVHARLDLERAQLSDAKRAAEAISGEPIDDVRPSDAMWISELAMALGVRTSTLRHWDAEGLVVPGRVSTRGARWYAPTDVRDARIVHQLRQAGYRIDALRTLMPNLRRSDGADDVDAALAAREASITARSRALLDAAGRLSAIIEWSG